MSILSHRRHGACGATAAPTATGRPWPSSLNAALRTDNARLLPRVCLHPLARVQRLTRPARSGVRPCTPAAAMPPPSRRLQGRCGCAVFNRFAAPSGKRRAGCLRPSMAVFVERRAPHQQRSAPASRVPAPACARAEVDQANAQRLAPLHAGRFVGPIRPPSPSRAQRPRSVPPLPCALTGLWRPADITHDYAAVPLNAAPFASLRSPRNPSLCQQAASASVRWPRGAAPAAHRLRVLHALRASAHPPWFAASDRLSPLRAGCWPWLRIGCRRALEGRNIWVGGSLLSSQRSTVLAASMPSRLRRSLREHGPGCARRWKENANSDQRLIAGTRGESS